MTIHSTMSASAAIATTSSMSGPSQAPKKVGTLPTSSRFETPSWTKQTPGPIYSLPSTFQPPPAAPTIHSTRGRRVPGRIDPTLLPHPTHDRTAWINGTVGHNNLSFNSSTPSLIGPAAYAPSTKFSSTAAEAPRAAFPHDARFHEDKSVHATPGPKYLPKHGNMEWRKRRQPSYSFGPPLFQSVAASRPSSAMPSAPSSPGAVRRQINASSSSSSSSGHGGKQRGKQRLHPSAMGASSSSSLSSSYSLHHNGDMNGGDSASLSLVGASVSSPTHRSMHASSSANMSAATARDHHDHSAPHHSSDNGDNGAAGGSAAHHVSRPSTSNIPSRSTFIHTSIRDGMLYLSRPATCEPNVNVPHSYHPNPVNLPRAPSAALAHSERFKKVTPEMSRRDGGPGPVYDPTYWDISRVKSRKPMRVYTPDGRWRP